MFQQLFRNIPDVTKNLLIINLLVFLASVVVNIEGYGLNHYGAAYYPESPNFEPYQIVTHFFMHGGLLHIFFNMFALVLFGSRLEMVWGPKRYLLFYLLTALGAYALHTGVQFIQIEQIKDVLSTDVVEKLNQLGKLNPPYDHSAEINEALQHMYPGQSSIPVEAEDYLSLMYSNVVGASGAIFGILIGFAMLFPNTELMLMFIPIPIKAKYLVGFYILAEIYLGWQSNPHDNIAHFAHLGGALIGAIMVWIWKRDRTNFF